MCIWMCTFFSMCISTNASSNFSLLLRKYVCFHRYNPRDNHFRGCYYNLSPGCVVLQAFSHVFFLQVIHKECRKDEPSTTHRFVIIIIIKKKKNLLLYSYLATSHSCRAKTKTWLIRPSVHVGYSWRLSVYWW